MTAIYKRELKAYLYTVIGPLFVAANMFLIGMYFVVYNLFDSYPYFAYSLEGASFLLLIAMPVLTMRIFAEERRNRTDQLILTAPVSVAGIVLGKFLAAVTVYAIPCIISGIYPLLMTRYGKVPMGESYVAILGFFLFGVACIAIGSFISSLFENQIIAAIVTFVALFLGYLMPSLCSMISKRGNVLTAILGFYDIYTPMESFIGGILDIASIVYYVSLCALFLFLTTQVIQKRRYTVSSSKPALEVYSILGIIISIAVMVLLNICVSKIPAKYIKIDATYNEMYSLSPQSEDMLAKLDEDVTLYVLMSKTEYDDAVIKTLERYESGSRHVKVEYIDTTLNPRFFAEYTTTAPNPGSIIVVSEKRNKVVDYNEMYETSMALNYFTYEYETQFTGYDAEGQITAAIDYVTKDDTSVILFIEGHGEYGLDSSYMDLLEKTNVNYEYTILSDIAEIPSNASCIYINGPVNDYSESDVKKLTDYLDKGGNIIVTITVNEQPMTNFEKLLEYMGITIKPGIVIEEDYNYYYTVPFYPFPEIEYCAYTSSLNEYGYMVLAPYNAGLFIDSDDENLEHMVFLKTSENSFLLKDYATVNTYTHDEDDELGPFPIGIEATNSVLDATMVVFASSMIFSEDADSVVGDANLIMFSNVINAFTDDGNNYAIPVKNFGLDFLTASWGDIVRSAVVAVVIVPIVILVSGIVIWIVRKRR